MKLEPQDDESEEAGLNGNGVELQDPDALETEARYRRYVASNRVNGSVTPSSELERCVTLDVR